MNKNFLAVLILVFTRVASKRTATGKQTRAHDDTRVLGESFGDLLGDLQGLPLPPIDRAKEMKDKICGEKVPILLTGSNELNPSFFTKRQLGLIEGIFNAMDESETLKDHGLLIGASAHGRAPPTKFDGWPLREKVWDNVIQERGHKMVNVPCKMLVFDKEGGDWTVADDKQMEIHHGDSLGFFSTFSDKISVTTNRIGTPDVEDFKVGKEPQQWQGVKSMPDVAMVFGGGPRAAQLATERNSSSDVSKTMFLSQQMTEENYPFKDGALFIFAVGGMSANAILGSKQGNPMSFKPDAVPEGVFEALTNADTIQFFKEKTEDKPETEIQDYANNVVEALEALVNARLP